MFNVRLKMKEKGFTLVEIMIVVLIIGVLVTIAVPLYNNMNVKANRASVEANLRTIESAITHYRAGNEGAMPVPADLSTYLQKWPVGPDGVTYTIDTGAGQVTKASDTGAWYTGANSKKLPITW